MTKLTLEEQLAGLPRPTGEDCPEHPAYPLVRKPEGDFCRRGSHYPGQPEREIEQPSVLDQPEACPLCGVAWSATWPGKPRCCLRGHAE